MTQIQDNTPESFDLPPIRVEPTNGTCNHTPSPHGYMQWHAWAEKASRTHKQIRCPHCGLWAIWWPKKQANMYNHKRWKSQNEFLKSQGLKPIPFAEY